MLILEHRIHLFKDLPVRVWYVYVANDVFGQLPYRYGWQLNRIDMVLGDDLGSCRRS